MPRYWGSAIASADRWITLLNTFMQEKEARGYHKPADSSPSRDTRWKKIKYFCCLKGNIWIFASLYRINVSTHFQVATINADFILYRTAGHMAVYTGSAVKEMFRFIQKQKMNPFTHLVTPYRWSDRWSFLEFHSKIMSEEAGGTFYVLEGTTACNASTHLPSLGGLVSSSSSLGVS